MKEIKKIILLLLLVLIPFNSLAISEYYTDKVADIVNVKIEENKINLYLFHGRDCPHCAEEKVWLEDVKDKYKVCLLPGGNTGVGWIAAEEEYSDLLIGLFEKLTDGTNQVVRIADTWSSEMIPISALSSIKEVSKNYLLTSNKGNKMIVDEETALFLNAIDGKTELVEILKKMPLKYRLKYGNNGTINMLVKYASVCSQLERQSMIERVGSKP